MLLHRRMLSNSTNNSGGGSSDVIDYSKQYFTMEVLENDVEIMFMCYTFGEPLDIISYSLDEGKTWIIHDEGWNFSIYANRGTKILWRILSNIKDNLETPPFQFRSSGKINVFGNLMSLYYFDDFENKSLTLIAQCNALFASCSVVDAKNLVLPKNTTPYCYLNMFLFNHELITAPKLVADYLSVGCYKGMFHDCSLLSYVEIHATVYDEYSDANMIFDSWLSGTAPTGIVKRKQEFTLADHYIPDGWTIEHLN